MPDVHPDMRSVNLRGDELTAWAQALSCAGVSALSLVLLPPSNDWWWGLGFGFGGGAIMLAIRALRARFANRSVRSSSRLVRIVGWTRGPDTSHYAVFAPGPRVANAAPEVVIRLSRVQRTADCDAWLCGRAEPSFWNSVALFDDHGALLGVGRVLPRAKALKVWQRRHRRTPWWVLGARDRNQPPSE